MSKSLTILLAGTLAGLMILAGCGGGGGGNGSLSNNSNNGSGTSGSKLSTYTDIVKSCTLYLTNSSFTDGGVNLTDWNSWDPGASGSVLGKLFNPMNGKDECIYSQTQMLDAHIQLVNQFSNQWMTSGTYTQGTMSAVVDTSFTSVIIPFSGPDNQDTMNRLVTLSVPDQNLTIHMAFYQNGGEQTVVEQYVIGSAESGVFYARVIGSNVRFWFASIGDHNVQGWLEGDTGASSFSISECTNASGGNWEVMGGGSVAAPTSEMAFMARNAQNNNSYDSYYINITLNDLENGTLQPIIDADAVPPTPSTDAEAYITQGDQACLGFFSIQDYPNSLDDLAWNQ